MSRYRRLAIWFQEVVKNPVERHHPPLADGRGCVSERFAAPRPSGSGAGNTCLHSFLAVILLAVAHLQAQQNPPHIAYALPAGGRRGTVFEVKIGGQFLLNAGAAHVSGPGVQAKVLDYTRPMNATQAGQLRDKLQELQKQPADAAVQKEIADIRKQLLIFTSNRNMSPALAETVTVQVSIAPEAEPGNRELRLGTPQGLSNPIAFFIGGLPEFSEIESINVSIQPGSNQPQIVQPATDMILALPATVNGRIKPGLAKPQVPARPGQIFTPGDADRYRFPARRGQHLVVVVRARELIPYLADAVPGWFQAVVTLFDAAGKELAFDDDYMFHPDPVLHYSIPADGEYAIEIRDALFRGREDFVYRLSIGELPFITGFFPLGGRTNTRTAVKLSGWNLPSEKLVMDLRGKSPGVRPLTGNGKEISNRPVFAVSGLPEGIEKEPNDSLKQARRIKLPVIINGRIGRSGDWDVFRFEGRAGEEIVAEVYARRLGSPLDSAVKLTDAGGRQLAFNDDHEDKAEGLNTHHADSLIRTRLPAKGTYYLFLGDAQHKGGAEFSYRLRLSPPQPDFELRVVPSSINARAGATVPITVYALRKDGFSGDIELDLKGAPEGFTMAGGRVPSGEDRIRLTLTVPATTAKEPPRLMIEGRARVDGKVILRPGIPAEDMMQAFIYRHLVPVQDLLVSVWGRPQFRVPIKILHENPARLAAGGTTRVTIAAPPGLISGQAEFELNDPPDGITIQNTSRTGEGVVIVLQSDAGKVKPGMKGNLIISAFAAAPASAAKAKPSPGQRRVPLATLPAIPFEIVRD